jgi:2-amino-4-hydroxy-6-hydroxymethyldihydropteridine diphosphokinase
MAASVAPIRAYIGLGSNLGNPVGQVIGAFDALGHIRHSHLADRSRLYLSRPLGGRAQPDYVNAVAGLDTLLEPLALLLELQRIEREYGRRRDGDRWAARTLDLDILVYGDTVIHSRSLSVPHPGLAERDFVLHPLAELAPDLSIPGLGRVSDLGRACPDRGLRPLTPT